VTGGRTDPSILKFGLKSDDRPESQVDRDLAVELAAMVDSGGLAAFLGQLGPRHTAYRALQQSLLDYREVKASGGWPVIDPGPTLKFGDRGMRVAMLRYRLAVSKDADFVTGVIDDHFDDTLAVAVMRFQRRHGLKVDGIAGPGTLAAMNVPVGRRIRQIELNLERWRWMPAELEPYYILVNIPAFELKVVEEGQTVKAMRAIVGREKRPTPLLSSMMTYLELNPYWYVPSKIAREDLLPKIQKDPQYLVRQKFQVFNSWDEKASALDPHAIDWLSLSENYFPFRLRQEPAPHNALGRVKFMFPNDLSVYIHDTPSKNLFVRASRDFSSGCVRVEKPLELASFLLNRQNWSGKRVTELLASKQRQVVILKKPVPVYLVYWTAWTGENGEVHFREDIYGHDRELDSLLAEKSEAEQRCAAMSHPTYFVRTNQGDSHPSAGI
jgi:murein L,D-transpeptidase YcbB/YkuD